MSNTAKLKQKAAEFEARKQYDKALELYEQVLNGTRASDEERDVPLYNRVGDLHYRIGNNEQAMGYFEQAADLYAEGGFFNNAIALCNKILRYSPGRTIVYYKLGIISAKKGFNSDAKQSFLEYADRMQRIGKMDEAFRALKEFADLCPGQDDVRLMLAEQLSRADRKTEALEQLELLYDTLQVEGRTSEAVATLERMKILDPAFKPRRSVTPRAQKKAGLVFLDLDFDESPAPAPAQPESAQPASAQPAPEPEPDADVPEGFELTSLSEEPAQRSELRFITPAEEESSPMLAIAPMDFAPTVEITSDATPDDEFIDLGEWLERNRTPSSTRMVAHDEEPENEEQKDFGEMLEKFKEGISRNVDEEDFGSHYDLGIAFREMGLLDEAIGSFQKAARGPAQRVRASEAIGECFMDKGAAGVTMTVLERLLKEPEMSDARLVGVLYLLGRAAEALGRPAEAAGYFQRVLAVQIGFRDAAGRLASLAQAST
ncbi:MAG: tetratricopeptide repeat protein [Gemmatimonadaceae bacterium]|nr:tetratricopeptide repeat protein [Gemmatimonadaceae bacterium]